ncbi:MAG: ORF6N domain-containing protein [Desulfuromonas sp.]|nr:ORF6N domain-containing protein [Desulfuromonas sp.]
MRDNRLIVGAENIQSMIFTVRGEQVMVDRDLADVYTVETKVLNQAVKRNIERFPQEFRFQLSDTEKNELVTNCDRFSPLKHSTTNPYVFTEQGVAMLSAVLRSDTAIKVSIDIINAFVTMRRVISANGVLLQRLDLLEKRQVAHEISTDNRFEKVFDALEQHNPTPSQGVFFNGQIFDAYVFINDLLRQAKKSIVLIDNYVDDRVLQQLDKRTKNVRAVILTKTISKQLAQDLKKHNAQYPPITIKPFAHSHDRFLLIDDDVYHIGASLKDLGKKWFAFSKMDKAGLTVVTKVEECWVMGSEWPRVKITEVCELIVDCVNKTAPKVDRLTPYKMLRTPNVKNGRVSTEDCKCVEEQIFNKWTRRAEVRVDDVLLTREAPLGEVGIVKSDEKLFLGQRLMQYRANPSLLNPDFLLYAFLSNDLQQQFRMHEGSGSVVSHIRVGDCSKFELNLPPLAEQQRIAEILSTLDQKIELNRQMNATLEAMAQALFKSWFVDFDPVIDNALAAGNPIPETLHARAATRKALGDKRKPLPAAIQQQFPSSFVFSEEMGWIPEGWEEAHIKDIAKIIKGKSYKSSELEESKTALVSLKSFNRGGGYRLDGLKEYTGTYKPDQEVFAGDLIIAYTDVTQAADVIGKPAMVVSDSRYEHLVVSLDVAVVRPGVNAHKYFLYGIAQTERFQDHTYSHSTGTTVLHLGKNAVPDYLIAMPDEDLVNAFAKFAEPTFQLIDKQIAEIGQLSALRDTLLPKLLSGELRIPDAEKLVGQVL